MLRRGCLMTLGFRRTASTRRGSSASTRGRWGRSATARSACRCTRSAPRGRCRWGGRCICRRSGVRTRSGGARRRSPRTLSLRPSRRWGSSSRCAPPAGRSARRRCWATRRTGITPSFATSCTRAAFSTCCRSRRRRPCSRSRRTSLSRGRARDRAARATTPAPLREGQLKTVTFRDGPDGRPVKSRFMFVRVRAAHHWRGHDGRGRWDKSAAEIPPREEWLIAEWPKGKSEPTDYWISNLSPSTKPGRLARLARLRWKIELDYRQLKGQLGLDHYEGRSWLGWYHHTALVTAAHGFLTLERLRPP